METSADLQERFLTFLRPALGRDQLQIHQLAGDASTRKYYRVIADEESWVLMSWDAFEDNGRYPFLSVRDHFSKHRVQVPAVIAKSPALGLVLLEDLGDLTLERKFWENQNQEMALPFYKLAIDEILKVHYDASVDRQENCTAFQIAFDTEKLLWEMNYGREHLLLGLCKTTIPQSVNKELDEIFTRICSLLHQEPKFIAHRDYHSRNLMIKLGKMRVIDFQDARMGAIQYDLVSLLRDSYVDLNADIEESLIQYYLDRRADLPKTWNLPHFSRAHFQNIYELQSIQRCFKACGSFASFYNLRNDTRYLKYLPQTLVRVRKSLEHFPEYRAFLNFLTDQGTFERKFEPV